MFKVFVLSSTGAFVQHGPARASEKQAVSVAKALGRRLGWVAVAAVACPAPRPAPSGSPVAALAGLSPVWKDAALAVRWAAGGRAAAVVAPAARSPWALLPNVAV